MKKVKISIEIETHSDQLQEVTETVLQILQKFSTCDIHLQVKVCGQQCNDIPHAKSGSEYSRQPIHTRF